MELPRQIELADRSGRPIEGGLRDAILSAVRKLKRRFRLLEDPDAAMEVAQMAAEKVSQRVDHSGTPRDIAPYAHATVRNLVITLARRRNRTVPLRDAVDHAVMPEAESNVLVRQALDQLSPDERRMILLWYQGFKSAEIAEIMGTTASNVDSIRSRARARLRAGEAGTNKGGGTSVR